MTIFAPIKHRVLTAMLILAQSISCIWYLLPSSSQAHIPGGFIKMMIFGVIALVVILITTVLYFIYKPTGMLWKIPFILSFGMLVLAWFYNK